MGLPRLPGCLGAVVAAEVPGRVPAVDGQASPGALKQRWEMVQVGEKKPRKGIHCT